MIQEADRLVKEGAYKYPMYPEPIMDISGSRISSDINKLLNNRFKNVSQEPQIENKSFNETLSFKKASRTVGNSHCFGMQMVPGESRNFESCPH